jgi:hypothetical protein
MVGDCEAGYDFRYVRSIIPPKSTICMPARFCINAGHGYVKLDAVRILVEHLFAICPVSRLVVSWFEDRSQQHAQIRPCLSAPEEGLSVFVVRAIMVNIFQMRVYEAPYSTLLKNTTGCSSLTSPRNVQLGVGVGGGQ